MLRRLHAERSKHDARNSVDVASIRARRRRLATKGFAGLRQGAVYRPGVDIFRSLEHGARQLQAWCLQLPVGNALASAADVQRKQPACGDVLVDLLARFVG